MIHECENFYPNAGTVIVTDCITIVTHSTGPLIIPCSFCPFCGEDIKEAMEADRIFEEFTKSDNQRIIHKAVGDACRIWEDNVIKEMMENSKENE